MAVIRAESASDAPGQGNPGMRFPDAMKALSSLQKPGAGVPAYTRWVNRRLARYAAAGAYTLGISPNLVTLISGSFSLAAILLLVEAPVTPLLGVPVAALFALGYMLDSADGQVARLGRCGSPAGEWLDHVVDAIRTPAIHLAVLVGVWRSHGPNWLMGIALLYCVLGVSQFMSQILAEQLVRTRSQGKASVPEDAGVTKSLVLIPTDTGTFCWIFVFWGAPIVFATAYALLFILNLCHTVISMKRKYRRLQAL